MVLSLFIGLEMARDLGKSEQVGLLQGRSMYRVRYVHRLMMLIIRGRLWLDQGV